MANTQWILDAAHSEIEFKVRHMMVTNVKGSFENFAVAIEGEDFTTAPIQVKIETDSINTKNADRDNHLKGADFFDAAQYPQISFSATKVEALSGNDYKLTGDLTIKDQTNTISLDLNYGGTYTDPWGNSKAGFVVEGKFNRKDFGLNWNAALEAGGVLVGEEVKISGNLEFSRQ